MSITTRIAAAALLLMTATRLQAQAACSYEQCALRIAPRWDGLAAVRDDGTTMANLAFFWPQDISAAFRADSGARGAGAAISYAGRAYSTRRLAAVLTDVGIGLLASAAITSAIRGSVTRSDAFLGGVGAAAFAISVPIQFAADDLLGKAVWWYNRRYAP